MTAATDDWQCQECKCYLPFGGTCLRCRDQVDQHLLREWINDHG